MRRIRPFAQQSYGIKRVLATLKDGTKHDVAGLDRATFSTVIESSLPLVIDRTMTWPDKRYGSHAEMSLPGPSTTWYLAEGATSDPFDVFYLLQNPNASPVTVAVT